MAFGQHTTGEEVAKACISRSEGKTCPFSLLTHSNPTLTIISVVLSGTSAGGIGAATAIALAHGKPKTIFLAGRTKAKIDPVMKEIKEIDAKIKTIFVPLDLADQDSVRKAAKEVLDSGEADEIHGLFNVAGIMCVPYSKTKQGIESQFGTVSFEFPIVI